MKAGKACGLSDSFRRNRCCSRTGLFALMLLVASVSTGAAQYYDEREYDSSSRRFFNAGFMQREFEPRSSNSNPDSLAIRYDRVMPVFGFRQGNFDVSFGYARYNLNGGSRTAIFFGASFANEFPVTGRGRTGLLVPVVVSLDYTKAESSGPSREDFNIGSGGIGVGLKFRHRASNLDFWVQAVEIAHFSSEGFGAGYGFSAATVGEAVLLWPNAPVFDGMVIGYRFRLQTWSMNEDRFNYRSTGHGPFLGVMF